MSPPSPPCPLPTAPLGPPRRAAGGARLADSRDPERGAARVARPPRRATRGARAAGATRGAGAARAARPRHRLHLLQQVNSSTHL